MTTYSKTDNYALNLYGDTDPADLRDGYNGSMHILDTTLETHLDRIEGVESRETHNEEVVEALLGDNTVDAATTSKNKWDNAASDSTDSMAALTALGTETVAEATTAKTKWDGASALASANKGDIAAIDANLNALHANSVTDAEGLRETITLNDRFNRAQNYKALYMGDSITEGYGATDPSKRWATLLSNMLGLQEVNVAIGGSSWTSIRDVQYDNAVQQIADPQNVKYVFAFSGINAYNDTASQQAESAVEAIKKITARYRNAIIFVGGCSLTNGYNNTSLWQHTGVFKAVEKAVMQQHYARVVFVHPWEWFYGCDSSITISDGLHPNDTGYSMIASGMYSAVVNGVEPGNCFIGSNGLVDFSFNYSEEGGPLGGDLTLKYSTNETGIFFKVVGSGVYQSASTGVYHGSASIPKPIASLVNITSGGFTVTPSIIKGGKPYTPSQTAYNDSNYFKFYSSSGSEFRMDYWCKYAESDKVTFDLTVFIPFSI